MPAETHPYPSIWERLAAHVEADPTAGEQRLVGAVQHAQSEPKSCGGPGCDWCVSNRWCSDWQGRLP